MESLQLYLNSNIADKYFDNNIANAEYILPLIEIPDGFAHLFKCCKLSNSLFILKYK